MASSSTPAPPGRPLSDAGHKRLSSFPSRQRRMGPAPLASFEDLSMDKTNSEHSSSSPEDHSKAALSEIGEEEGGGSTTKNEKEILSVPTSPRIRIEAASSPSQHDDSDSKESTPEKEHFSGYKKEEFCEEMSDLQKSTDELDPEEEKARKKRLKAQQQQMAEMDRREERLKLNDTVRKGSSSSVISEGGLLPITSGHSSRLSSLGSIGSPARRSPSPHKMLLETSFCGNKPIQHPSIDIEDPPISTSDIMQYAIAKLESIKSPLEAKPPDIFRSTSPVLPSERRVTHDISPAQNKQLVATRSCPDPKYSKVSEATLPQIKSQEGASLHSKPPSATAGESKPVLLPDSQQKVSKQEVPVTKAQVKSQELTKSLQRRQEQQRRQAEHHEYYQRQTETLDRKAFRDSSSFQNEENRKKELESERIRMETLPRASERQSRLEKRQTGSSPRSPRLAKKVPTPQVPDLRDLPRTSPNSPASSVSATTPDFHTARSSKSTTPGESPRSVKEATPKEKEGGTSLVRKGSFASFFRKSDTGVSPVTPDSPGSSSGRKSPFSQFIRNAENKIRSRSRSRSRSKSRDRELDDDTHDRRKVLSIFRPSKKKKRENGAEADKGEASADEQITKDPINNVEFKFNSEGTYQSSTFGLIRQESEVTRAIKEPLTGDGLHNEGITNAEQSTGPDGAVTDYTPYINEAGKKGSITENFSEEVTKSLRAREEELKKLEKEDEEMYKEAGKYSVIDKTPKDLKKVPPHVKDKPVAANLQIQNDQEDSLSISESERGSEIEYFKKKGKGAAAHVESPDNENKGLVSQDSFEDDELPFVPTTLPQEKSIVPHIIPVKERAAKLKMTQSIDRPRSTTPIQPSRLEAYKQSSQELVDTEADKLTISIKVPQPGAVKVLPTRAPKVAKRQGSKSWEDFCSEGLRSPRQLRRQYKEKQQPLIKKPSSPPPPPPPPPPNWKSPTRDKVHSSPATPLTSATTSPRFTSAATTPKWINFDEMPSIVLKPVRQMKTVPPKRQSTSPTIETFEQKREFFSSQLNKAKEELKEHNKPTPRAPTKVDDSDKECEEHSSEESEEEKPTSISSSEELSTVRETIEKLKQTSSEDTYENSDLERLLAPVNECISKLSSLASSAESQPPEQRRSPIPDNWEDFLLPPQPGRRSRLSSLGSDAGSIGGMRSPSPSVMLLETSFCGNQPIDDPALAEPDLSIPMARKLSGISLGDFSPLTQRGDRASIHSGQYLTQPDRSSVMSDSSGEGGSPRESDYDLSGNQRGQHGGQSHLNPFGMDLELKSNRSSIISQDQQT